MISVAETVQVRSGEHFGFSRLVFQFETLPDWQMGRSTSGYILLLGLENPSVNLADIFSRIPRTRISDVSIDQDRGHLEIHLACSCHADAFELSGARLVIDIKDGPPPANSAFETIADLGQLGETPEPNALIVEEMAAEETLAGEAPLAPENAATGAVEVVDADENSTRRELVLPSMLPEDQNQITLAPLSAFIPDTEVELLTDGSDILATPEPDNSAGSHTLQNDFSTSPYEAPMESVLRQLSRATSQGLLNPRAPLPDLRQPAAPIEEIDIAAESLETGSDIRTHLNVSAETSIDRGVRDLIASHISMTDGGVCLPDSVFDIAAWGSEEDIYGSISTARMTMLSQADTVDYDAFLAAVRAYIYAGFGLEAERLLEAYPVELPNVDILRAMAQIMDHGLSDGFDRLADQLDCNNSAALWAVLAQPRLTRGQVIETRSVIATFSGLPLHLRRLLGPVLATKFIEIEDIETVEAIQSSITRAAGSHGNAFTMVEARIDIADGHDDSAGQTLRQVVDADGPVAPEALVALILLQIEQNQSVELEFIDMAEALAYEHRGSEIGSALANALIFAYAQTGQYDEAIAALENAAGARDDEQQLADAWRYLAHALGDEPRDHLFLEVIFRRFEFLKQGLPSASSRMEYAQRLVSLGFSTTAVELLDPPQHLDATGRELLARAALAQSNPARAIAEIVPNQGQIADEIRAEAYTMLGDLARAVQYATRASRSDIAETAAWRSGDWHVLSLGESEVHRNIADMMQALETRSANPQDYSGSGAIARSLDLIEQSTSARATVGDMLEDHPSPGS